MKKLEIFVMEVLFYFTGGFVDGISTRSVLRYDKNDINSEPANVASMKSLRVSHACTIFYSPAHDGRSVVIVAGGSGNSENTAEIWDYTNEGSTWKESKLFSTISSLIVIFKKYYKN